MDIKFTEEQELLRSSVQRLLRDQYDFDARRKIVASEEGVSRKQWADLAELGLFAAPFSEDVVIERARQLSQAPYAPPEDTIQPHTKTLITTSIAPSASRKIWRCGGTTI